ncbi:phosphoribosyltransferase family protein [soil metagenome]
MVRAERYADRSEAGRVLAHELEAAPPDDPVVLALPRGGVPVAAEIAAQLQVPAGVFVVRKVGAPGRAELGIGAVPEGGVEVRDEAAIAALRVSAEQFSALAADQQVEVDRRVRRYRGASPLPPVAGREVVVVDDGLATGVTAEAAVRDLRARGPRSLTLAVPVAAASSHRRLAELVDRLVCPWVCEPFLAVGEWYHDFRQTTDDEVVAALAVDHGPSPAW